MTFNVECRDNIWAYLSIFEQQVKCIQVWRTEELKNIAILWLFGHVFSASAVDICGPRCGSANLNSLTWPIKHQSIWEVELIFGRTWAELFDVSWSFDPLNSNSSDLCLTFVTFRKLMKIQNVQNVQNLSKSWNFQILSVFNQISSRWRPWLRMPRRQFWMCWSQPHHLAGSTDGVTKNSTALYDVPFSGQLPVTSSNYPTRSTRWILIFALVGTGQVRRS